MTTVYLVRHGEAEGNVFRRIHRDDGILQHPDIPPRRILLFFLKKCIACLSVFSGDLRQLHFTDITRNGRLCHPEAALIQFCCQFFLRLDLTLVDQLQDFCLPRKFHNSYPIFLRKVSRKLSFRILTMLTYRSAFRIST